VVSPDGVALDCDHSEPLPDFAVLIGPESTYQGRHPTAADALLVIEVSDTTAQHDLGSKMALYAHHGVQELWVVELQRRRLHTFRNPAGATYEEVVALDDPGCLALPYLPGTKVDISSLYAELRYRTPSCLSSRTAANQTLETKRIARTSRNHVR
jgi:Uma2 family endonuclease